MNYISHVIIIFNTYVFSVSYLNLTLNLKPRMFGSSWFLLHPHKYIFPLSPNITPSNQERQKNVKRAEKEINQEVEDLYQLRFGKDEEMSIQATTAVTENTVLLKKYPYNEVTSKEFGK